MPPLQLNDEEMTVLLTLAGPIDHRLRPDFLREVVAEIEAGRQAGEIGPGMVHRCAGQIQCRSSTRRGSAKKRAEHEPARGGGDSRLARRERRAGGFFLVDHWLTGYIPL